MNGMRDHGGGIDAAAARWGGRRADWLDLSTGINPRPYPVVRLPADAWTALPDRAATGALMNAARRFWRVPDGVAGLSAPGASALIARIPSLLPPGKVAIAARTYNEHAAAFAHAGWKVVTPAVGNHAGPGTAVDVQARVVVHPNNPDGTSWDGAVPAGCRLLVVDESFCDTRPEASLIHLASRPGVLVLKSFGKFWGLAGLRLGFAFGDPALIEGLGAALGPWPVSGPALAIGARALADLDWAAQTRARLDADARRLDALMKTAGARVLGGTSLFRLYDTGKAQRWQDHLARHRIWTRVFPYAGAWLRLGLPGSEDGWARLQAALQTLPPDAAADAADPGSEQQA